MQFTTTLMSLLLATSASANMLRRAQDVCEPGNNCQREVQATRFGPDGQATRTSDCMSYQTITKYTTPSNGQTSYNIPTAVPAYASDCNGAAYASACSCIGIIASTTTSTVGTPGPCPANGNNCQRAVFGTRTNNAGADQASKMADCMSFFSVTVVTTTNGVTTSVITPTSTPAYATACSTAGSYESACSCYGLQKTTTTVSAPWG